MMKHSAAAFADPASSKRKTAFFRKAMVAPLLKLSNFKSKIFYKQERTMSKALETQRTYALIGTGGCGKTSLAEMLLFQSGVNNRLGAIEEGTTTLYY